ncbi:MULTISPECIES: diacylglycerol kinase [Aeribacillus]|jgi:diacylglycerol kinase (ATP)|uniref:diacylglycerol kinase n=1 Tax=Aeribacillus TaxID=1055323 RepID=UPI00139852B4|nr:diacylglycerol kinase [Aeribacillus composti]MDR9792398.1 diacylglycerol kinase [Aeribacillus pallidus]MDR9797532.1 diacylglycerol kinase [Aeribacillus pallidus]MED0702068.1 diacylglycerol kinase [Aeribacillus composti]MED0716111.1 diacylglycerol kinase [Aeribacillus composti]MED0746209.1 diacylglycerol kinase [Aeribacillus composti]
MKRARIIYNPTSGREAFKKQLPEVLAKFEEAGYETSCHATTGEGDATNAAKQAAERGFDLIIAAGGDGTVNEVVNGLAVMENRPTLGIIPVGTTNDFARAIGIPRDNILHAVDTLLNGVKRKIDIGKVNDQYFINIAGGGKLTELTYDVPSKLKTVLGQLAYYLKGIEMLPSIHPTEVEIEYDGKLFQGEIMLFLISLTNSVGGFEKLAPDSILNDGMFDLLILKKVSLAEFIRLASLALKGEHIHSENVIYTKANRIKVKTEDKMQLNLDGEYGGLLPAEFENLYQYIEIIMSKEKAEKNAPIEKSSE